MNGFLMKPKIDFAFKEIMTDEKARIGFLSAVLKLNPGDLLLWAKFINAERKEDFEMIAERNQYIGSAYKRLQVISQDREKQLEYEAREKAVRDYNQMMKEAEERGEKRGEERGKEAGAVRIALNMIQMGFETDMISQATGLAAAEIEALRK